MRRTYISPEFDYYKVYGTYNMREESSLWASKMLEIEESLILDNSNLIYYQNSNQEQIDLSIETSLPSISYSTSEDKKINHSLVIDPSQSSSQKEGQTMYIMTINLKTILSNYLFAILKQYRTFEGVKREMTANSDVDYSIKEYITKNVLDRYKFQKVELYLKYTDIRTNNIRRFSTIWNDQIGSNEFQVSKFVTQTEFDDSKTTVTFNQAQVSTQYAIEYYFKLLYKKA
jgi:hypothetical protein